ncbi:MAG: 1-aminocyclopropane-1-carboxylate deaminase/D-cysteine desulfhydrase [Flavobacteriales bacterium]|jgi:1-aminocyclopropane-1-carboxylate deaminase|nr:1-aminocyclopropane-1-carboxylate deaminase/D-cysteine desulfhydrase [Flavobacteriales bacterium]
MLLQSNSPTNQIVLKELEHSEIELWIKRDDQINPLVSGNKLFKLIRNIEEALDKGKETILTFGGAYSNHIAATALYCKINGLKSIGVIRGEETLPLNPTLNMAVKNGMQLEYISRTAYRQKEDPSFLAALSEEHCAPFIIPEGGANWLGILGAKSILNEDTTSFDTIVCPVGTGTTMAGLMLSKEKNQKIVGINIHKHADVLNELIGIHTELKRLHAQDYRLENEYHLGGYAKWNPALIRFIQEFHRQTNIKLDPIYTGKAMAAVVDLIQAKTFTKGSKVLFIHTGGLQGINGFELRHNLKLFPS